MPNGYVEVTITGNVTADPELRFTQSGAAVLSFTVASTPRKFNSQSGKWEDGEPLFMRCNAWRQLAENVAESVHRGSRVVVTGTLKQRSFETKEGEKRTVVEVDADEVAASMKFAQVAIRKVERSGDGAGGGGQAQQQPPARDPWAMDPPKTSGGFTEEPPF